jgi:hypothetical protein
MSNGFFEYDNQSKGRCDGCGDCRTVYATGGWSFLGCYHKPYHGKWVCEIRDCPIYHEAEEDE